MTIETTLQAMKGVKMMIRKIIIPMLPILLLLTSCASLHKQAFAPSTVPTSNFIILNIPVGIAPLKFIFDYTKIPALV